MLFINKKPFKKDRMILVADKVNKSFGTLDKKIDILHDISFSLELGESLAIVGASGSGKTTLLGLCAGLDKVSSGQVNFQDLELSKLSQDDLAKIRNKKMAFIFQNFQLLPSLTALENVMLPAELIKAKSIEDRAKKLLSDVGLAERFWHYPSQLSGGEQQRVAIARAFINQPQLLFADEPTGNLDTETSEKIINLLFKLNKNEGTSLIIVTHNLDLAALTTRVIKLKNGRITDNYYN
jgi:putative ABC transport system ATP-binding protein